MSYQYKRDECPHPDYSNEIILGSRTGDIVCTGCGDTFAPSEPEFRKMKADHERRVREAAKRR